MIFSANECRLIKEKIGNFCKLKAQSATHARAGIFGTLRFAVCLVPPLIWEVGTSHALALKNAF